ncbi:MAG: hypothetical protein GY862_15815 [Gammaproteobacteria bacterium]|nr:hypothetical protein [Gammaproteobacteria bacterium]
MRSFSAFKKNLILLLITFALAIGLCELLVRMFVPVRNVGPSFTVYDPVYGKRLKKNISVTRITQEFTMRFTTNSLGFRGPEPESGRPMLFLGDSFTMGYGVNDGEEFPALVRKSLSARGDADKIQVINMGMGHNGNGRWIKFLKREAKHPHLVVLQLMENDFDDNLREHLYDLTPSGELRERKIPPPSMSRNLQKIVEFIPGLSYSYLVSLGRQIHWGTPQQGANKDDSVDTGFSDAERLTFRYIEEALSICKSHDWPVLGLNVSVEGKRLAEVKKLFSAHSAQFINVPAKEQRPDLYYIVDGHWNAAGHAFTANLLLEQF